MSGGGHNEGSDAFGSDLGLHLHDEDANIRHGLLWSRFLGWGCKGSLLSLNEGWNTKKGRCSRNPSGHGGESERNAAR